MPIIETEYEQGKKAGRRDAQSPPIILNLGLPEQKKPKPDPLYIHFETDFDRGYKVGQREVWNPPIDVRSEYQKGFDAGKSAAGRDLYPSGQYNFCYLVK